MMSPPLQIVKSFRYRVYPTAEQEARLLRWESALRFLWNLAHEQRLMGLARTDKRYPSDSEQGAELTTLRAELSWLAEVPRNCCDAVLCRLHSAWMRCFSRLARAPRWKRKGIDAVSLTEAHGRAWKIDGGRLFFPGLGGIRAVIHRPPTGRLTMCTISRDGDQWFASVVSHIEIDSPSPRVAPIVALDRGVVNAAADSDGRLVESPRFYAAAMKRLARAQQTVSRRKKGSKNREKAKLRVARLHRKVRRQREHFVHGLSAAYAKSHGVVAVESLNVAGMVRANRGLARGILDAGWGQLVECLKYKLAWSGGSLVEVPAAYSSQTCSVCGVVDAKSRRSQSGFICTGCGHVDHADLNAAKVLLQRANRSLLPVEGSVLKAARRSRKGAPSSGSPRLQRDATDTHWMSLPAPPPAAAKGGR